MVYHNMASRPGSSPLERLERGILCQISRFLDQKSWSKFNRVCTTLYNMHLPIEHINIPSRHSCDSVNDCLRAIVQQKLSINSINIKYVPLMGDWYRFELNREVFIEPPPVSRLAYIWQRAKSVYQSLREHPILLSSYIVTFNSMFIIHMMYGSKNNKHNKHVDDLSVRAAHSVLGGGLLTLMASTIIEYINTRYQI